MNPLPLTILSQNSLKVTVGWTKPADAVGYRFFRDSQPVSSSWDPLKTQVTFGLPDGKPHTFTVLAVTGEAQGTVTVNGPAPPPPPPPSVMPRQGISSPEFINRSSADQDWELDRVKELGNGHPMFFRLDWWPNMASQFAAAKQKMDARGIVPMPLINWAFGKRPAIGDFARYCVDAARWSRFVNPLNEPDMNGWSPEDAAEYFQAAKTAIKNAGIDAVLVGPTSWKNGQDPARGFAWDKAWIEAGARPDLFSKHLYDPVTADRGWNNWAWLPDIRALLDGHGMASVPIITTEAGANVPSHSETYQVTAVSTGMDQRNSSTAKAGIPLIASYLAYSVFDTFNDAAGGFGLVRGDRSKRPAYGTFQQRAA